MNRETVRKIQLGQRAMLSLRRTGATIGKVSLLVTDPTEAVIRVVLDPTSRSRQRAATGVRLRLYFRLQDIASRSSDGSAGSRARRFQRDQTWCTSFDPVPPLPEQRRIVGILDEAFDGIATAKANAEKNLQNARALFESHLQSVFTQRGEGWVEKRLGDIAERQYGLCRVE